MSETEIHPPEIDPSEIEGRLARVNSQIAQCCQRHRRARDSVRLIAVGKKHAAQKVAALANLGHCDLAENYVQEAVDKIAQVAQLQTDKSQKICWHFIGRIQSRKCRAIAAHFDWVHTIDSEKVAAKLNDARDAHAPLNVLIQVNPQGEDGKGGVSEAELLPLAEAIGAMPNLSLRGLMVIPKLETDPARQRRPFAECRRLRDLLNARGFELAHLSMGMSGDLEAAIAEGATMVRVGTGLYGVR